MNLKNLLRDISKYDNYHREVRKEIAKCYLSRSNSFSVTGFSLITGGIFPIFVGSISFVKADNDSWWFSIVLPVTTLLMGGSLIWIARLFEKQAADVLEKINKSSISGFDRYAKDQ